MSTPITSNGIDIRKWRLSGLTLLVFELFILNPSYDTTSTLLVFCNPCCNWIGIKPYILVLILQGGCIPTQFQFGIAIFSTDLMVLSSDPHEWYGCDPKVAATVVQILHKCNFDCTLTATPRASPYMWNLFLQPKTKLFIRSITPILCDIQLDLRLYRRNWQNVTANSQPRRQTVFHFFHQGQNC